MVSQPISSRSEATFPAYGWGRASPSSHADPQVPNRSEQVTGMPSLANTACTCSLPDDRIRTSLIRYAEARIMPMPGRVAWVAAVAGAGTSA